MTRNIIANKSPWQNTDELNIQSYKKHKTGSKYVYSEKSSELIDAIDPTL